MNIKIKCVDDLENLKDIESVWRLCNWGWNDKNSSKMASTFKYRWKNIIAYDNEVAVGYVGIISDQNAYALVVDMMVSPAKQKNGIGMALMEKLVSECKKADIKMIKLISSVEGKKLYESCGFEVCTDETPGMMLKLYELQNKLG